MSGALSQQAAINGVDPSSRLNWKFGVKMEGFEKKVDECHVCHDQKQAFGSNWRIIPLDCIHLGSPPSHPMDTWVNYGQLLSPGDVEVQEVRTAATEAPEVATPNSWISHCRDKMAQRHHQRVFWERRRGAASNLRPGGKTWGATSLPRPTDMPADLRPNWYPGHQDRCGEWRIRSLAICSFLKGHDYPVVMRELRS